MQNRMQKRWTSLAGTGVGAGLMYYLNPDRAQRRQRRLKNRARLAGHRFQSAAQRPGIRNLISNRIENGIEDRLSERIAERLDDRLSDHLSERVAERIGERLDLNERIGESIGDRIGEHIGERLGERIEAGTADRLGARLSERLSGRFGERMASFLGNRMGQRLSGRIGERFDVNERIGERVGNRIGSRISNRIGSRMENRLGERFDASDISPSSARKFFRIRRFFGRLRGDDVFDDIEDGVDRSQLAKALLLKRVRQNNDVFDETEDGFDRSQLAKALLLKRVRQNNDVLDETEDGVDRSRLAKALLVRRARQNNDVFDEAEDGFDRSQLAKALLLKRVRQNNEAFDETEDGIDRSQLAKALLLRRARQNNEAFDETEDGIDRSRLAKALLLKRVRQNNDVFDDIEDGVDRSQLAKALLVRRARQNGIFSGTGDGFDRSDLAKLIVLKRARQNRWGTYASIGILAAGLMYYFNPQRGWRRRSLIKDRLAHARHIFQSGFDKTERDFRRRTTGVLAAVRNIFSNRAENIDEVLAQRVRAHLARITAHPRSIQVSAQDGRVTLSGPALSEEVGPLVLQVYSVRGVKDVENRLDAHDEPGRAPGLQGQGQGTLRAALSRRANWSPAVRLIAGVTGVYAFLAGARRGGFTGVVAALGGSALTARAATNLEFSRMTGIGARQRAIDVQKTIRINAPVQQVFAQWSDFENFPKFMNHVRQVRRMGDEGQGQAKRWRWTVDGPARTKMDFDVGIVDFKNNRLIAWSTDRSSLIQHLGRIEFIDEGDGTTTVKVRMSYNPIVDALGRARAIAKFFGADPKRQIDDDLIRLKSYIETGKLPQDTGTYQQQSTGAGAQQRSSTSRQH